MKLLNIFAGLFSRKATNTKDLESSRMTEVLNFLEEGAHSVQEINRHIHSTEARMYIARLRKQGYKIEDFWVHTETKRNAYKRYFIA